MPAAGELLNVVPGRTRTAVEQWFSGCQPAWRDAIGTASLDPFRGYLTALAVSLPQAVRMLDAFHVVKLAQTPLDEVRRRRQQEQRGRRGQTGVPLYRDLRRGPHTHTHTVRSWARTEPALTDGDPAGSSCKHSRSPTSSSGSTRTTTRTTTSTSTSTSTTSATKHTGSTASPCAHCADSPAPELHPPRRTLDPWRSELLAYWTSTFGAG